MEYFGNFLDKEGGIALSSTDKLVEVMKDSQDKLVPKCMAITIISLSTPDVQTKLCESGIWNILFQWLQDGLKNDTTCFIIEILRLYLTLPISFENLTSNSCPKLIKKLTKNGNPDIISIARNIVTKWKKLVEERTSKADIPEVPIKKIKLDDTIIKFDKVHEDKKKIRTVKVRNTDLRTAGVEDPDLDSPKSVKKTIKKAEEKPGMEELHQKVNANVDKRKVIEIHESKNFINSIMQTPVVPKKKKKRQDTSINKSASDVSFNEDITVDAMSKESPLPDSLSLPEKPKKRVSWAPNENLQNIKYFELDENERVNVNKVSIEEMKKKERMIERQYASRNFNSGEIEDDNQSERWYKPLTVVSVTANKVEINSVEKTAQFERERKVLKVLYFTKEDIPPTPTEPDNESYDVKDPLMIPLEDVVALGQKTQNNNNNKATVPPNKDGNSKLLVYTEKEGSECHVALRPDVANLLKSMTQSPNQSTESTASTSMSESNNTEAPQTRTKLINIIRSRYPDIDPEKLSSEEVCRLLEPLREQLIREGILSMPTTTATTTVAVAVQNMAMPPTNYPPPLPPQNQVPCPPPWFNDPRSQFPMMQTQQRMQYPGPPRPPPMPAQPPLPPMNRAPFIIQPRHSRPVCRFMANNGFCRLGNNCTFSHVLSDNNNNNSNGVRQFNHNRH